MFLGRFFYTFCTCEVVNEYSAVYVMNAMTCNCVTAPATKLYLIELLLQFKMTVADRILDSVQSNRLFGVHNFHRKWSNVCIPIHSRLHLHRFLLKFYLQNSVY